MVRAILWRLRRLILDQRGQDFVEYALLVMFLAVAAAAFLPEIGDDLGDIVKRLCQLMKKAGKAAKAAK